MLKISAVYLIEKAEIPIHYTIWALVEQALLICTWLYGRLLYESVHIGMFEVRGLKLDGMERNQF
jgi:hypothetical protein